MDKTRSRWGGVGYVVGVGLAGLVLSSLMPGSAFGQSPPEAEAPPEETEETAEDSAEVVLLREIRDALAAGSGPPTAQP